MILSDLLNSVSNEDFLLYTLEHGLDVDNLPVFERLQKTKPKLNDCKMEVELREGLSTLIVSGVYEGDDETYSLSFMMDAEYVGCELTQHTLDKFDKWDIIYTAVDEMWWDDDTKQEHIDSINKQLEEIENGTAITYSMEEVMEEINAKT